MGLRILYPEAARKSITPEQTRCWNARRPFASLWAKLVSTAFTMAVPVRARKLRIVDAHVEHRRKFEQAIFDSSLVATLNRGEEIPRLLRAESLGLWNRRS